MGMIPIRCIACGEAAQIDEAWLGQLVECPHCRQPTPAAAAPPQAPAAAPPPPSPPPPQVESAPSPESPPTPKSEPAAAPAKRPPLTRAERQAIRRRRQTIVAFVSGLLLLVAFLVLMAIRG
jgi:hypothetical protein